MGGYVLRAYVTLTSQMQHLTKLPKPFSVFVKDASYIFWYISRKIAEGKPQFFFPSSVQRHFDFILILILVLILIFFLTVGCPRRAACVVAAEAAGIRSTEVDFGVDGWGIIGWMDGG